MEFGKQPLPTDRPAQALSSYFLVAAERLRRHPRFRLALARHCRQMANESPVARPLVQLSDDLLGEFEQWACWEMIHFDGLTAKYVVF